MNTETYIGKPCKRGGHTERYKRQGNCVVCARLRRSEFYQNNKEMVCAESMKYHALNRERVLARQRKHYVENKEYFSAKSLEYRQLNRATAAKRSREWRDSHPGRNAQSVKEWLMNHPLKTIEYSNARRARKALAPGRYTPDDILTIISRQNGRCLYCCVLLNGKFHVDHIVALARGGTNDPSNICIACKSCNVAKNVVSSETFALRLLA